jgi:outer membrane protein assembly factor BamB
MKSLFIIFFYLSITSCSFDNKTGIWKDASNFPVEKEDVISIDQNNKSNRHEDIFIKTKLFNEEKKSRDNSVLKLALPIKIENWTEKYASLTNNISNFFYEENRILLSKSSKLSKTSLNKDILFYKNNLITYDNKGKIFIYSLNLKKKIYEYNFYKKNFKNVEKEIHLVISDNILYAADNLGYLYAISMEKKLLVWAKNYGIPFRSNLKIINEQIFLANQDNVIYSIDVKNGGKNWQFATGLTFLKSDFYNNFALDEVNKSLFFLNTSGELYSINYVSQKIQWILNFKNASFGGDGDLFLSHPIVIKNNNLIISTEKALLNYDIISGAKNWSFPTNSTLKPIATNNYIYTLSKTNLLICIDNKSGKILWSRNIYNNPKVDKISKKIGKFYDLKIVNSKLNVFSNNGYLLSFNHRNGNLNFIKKISKNGISSEIFFLKGNMFLVDNNKKLLKYN